MFDLVHFECLFYFVLLGVFLLDDHFELWVLEIADILAPALFKEGLFQSFGGAFGASLGRSIFELKSVFIIIHGIAFPAGNAFPPGWDLEAASAANAAIAALGFFMSHIFEIFLHVHLLIFVVVLEVEQCRYPPLLDELVVACELPGDQFAGVAGGEIVVLVYEGASDVLSLQHVLRLELDREVGRCWLETIHSVYVQDLDGAFGQLVELLKDLYVVAWVDWRVPVKDFGMLE